MKKGKLLHNIIDNSKLYVKNNSSTMLTVLGAIGVIGTSIATTKSTIRAFKLVNEAECEKKDDLSKKRDFFNCRPCIYSFNITRCINHSLHIWS